MATETLTPTSTNRLFLARAVEALVTHRTAPIGDIVDGQTIVWLAERENHFDVSLIDELDNVLKSAVLSVCQNITSPRLSICRVKCSSSSLLEDDGTLERPKKLMEVQGKTCRIRASHITDAVQRFSTPSLLGRRGRNQLLVPRWILRTLDEIRRILPINLIVATQ